MAAASSVEEYLATLPDERRTVMDGLRRAIRAAAPGATEHIAYDMPAFKLHGHFLIGYAAYKRHYSLFAASEAVLKACGDELKPFLTGKATISFRANRPLPPGLVTKIAKARFGEIASRGPR